MHDETVAGGADRGAGEQGGGGLRGLVDDPHRVRRDHLGRRDAVDEPAVVGGEDHLVAGDELVDVAERLVVAGAVAADDDVAGLAGHRRARPVARDRGSSVVSVTPSNIPLVTPILGISIVPSSLTGSGAFGSAGGGDRLGQAGRRVVDRRAWSSARSGGLRPPPWSSCRAAPAALVEMVRRAHRGRHRGRGGGDRRGRARGSSLRPSLESPQALRPPSATSAAAATHASDSHHAAHCGVPPRCSTTRPAAFRRRADARRDADAVVAGPGERDPGGERGLDVGDERGVVRAVLRERAGEAADPHVAPAGGRRRGAGRCRPAPPATSSSSVRCSTGSPSRPSEMRSTTLPGTCQWAHFCEPNEAAVTRRWRGLGTR